MPKCHCGKQALFNMRGSKALFCVLHKEPNMVDVKNKTCELCETIPAYNIRGSKIARFCVLHKEPNMVDVKNKTCELCETRCYYGLLGKGTTHCSIHRQKGMITSPNRKCEKCPQLGTHEANGSRYCEDHKPEHAENLGLDNCSECKMEDILTNGKCSTCDPTVVQIRRHAKELRVKDVFKALISNFGNIFIVLFAALDFPQILMIVLSWLAKFLFELLNQ
jgi:hypothetical protein